MDFDQQFSVAAPAEEVWDFLVDVPRVSACLPGLTSLREVGDNAYEGILGVTVGPIKTRLEGRLELTRRRREDWSLALVVQASDRRIKSSLKAVTTMDLVPGGEHETEVRIRTEAAMMGKLGQFGQAVLRAKADQILETFAENVSRELRHAAEDRGEATVIAASDTAPEPQVERRHTWRRRTWRWIQSRTRRRRARRRR